MGYISINETDKFGYSDCVINKATIDESGIRLELEALIVKSANSQNSNYTDSYAGDTVCILKNAKIYKILKVGYKYYDANDRLIEEMPDEVMQFDNGELSQIMAGAYLPEFIDNGDGNYSVVVEMASEDISENTDEYIIEVNCEEVSMSWEQYMNRVQN